MAGVWGIVLKRACAILFVILACTVNSSAEGMKFRLFDWLTGNDPALHKQMIEFFKLDPARFPKLQQLPGGGLQLENPGGAPSAIAYAPLELEKPGLWTMRFDARCGGEGVSGRATASFSSARLDFTATSDWAQHALSVRVPGPMGPSTVAFTLHGRHGRLDIRGVELVNVPFDARVGRFNGELRLQLIGQLPTDGNLVWQSGEETGTVRLSRLPWKMEGGIPSAHLQEPSGIFYDWTVTAGEPARVVLVGNRVRLTPVPAVRRGPMTYAVTIRDDGAMLVQGRPFLPMGLYLHATDVAAVEEAARAGLNLLLIPTGTVSHSDGRDAQTQQLVTLARKLGLQVIVETGVPAEADAITTAVHRNVSLYGQLPLMAWTAVDEPDLKAAYAQTLPQIYAAMAAADGRPLYQANHTPQSFWTAGAACDILAVDPYPLSAITRPISTVGQWIDEARAAVGVGHSVWCVQQAFVEAPFWPTPPTPEQLHAMTWIALNHGALGIVYYAMREVLDPDATDFQWDLRRTPLWDEITRETAEVHGLETFLLQPGARSRIPAGASIDASMWVAGNGEVLISLVNLSDRESEVLLNLPASDLNRLHILPHGPTVAPHNGTLALRLPPYGVILLKS